MLSPTTPGGARFSPFQLRCESSSFLSYWEIVSPVNSTESVVLNRVFTKHQAEVLPHQAFERITNHMYSFALLAIGLTVRGYLAAV